MQLVGAQYMADGDFAVGSLHCDGNPPSVTSKCGIAGTELQIVTSRWVRRTSAESRAHLQCVSWT